MTALIKSNEKMESMKVDKSLEDFCLLKEGVTQITDYETKGKRGRFMDILLNTLGASLLGHMSAGNKVKEKQPGQKIMKATN